MADITASLRKVKTVFESRGISGDPKIAEHVAFLLLVHEHNLQPDALTSESWERLCDAIEDDLAEVLEMLREDLIEAHQVPPDVVPQPPPERLRLRSLRQVMEFLLEGLPEGEAGAVFQRYLRFELLKSAKGGQYPTPYHVATAMAQLIDLSLGNSVVDPTCGTAGLLVAAVEQQDELEITGCDFDATWAALGWSNLVLHGQAARITVESALSLLPEHRGQFDRVLMNPPFGGALSSTELRDIIEPKYGRRNETVLAALALELLAGDGRGAALVSRGVLFGGGAEQELRNRLLRERLEAVVALPDDAMQPYNSTGANLLLFQKTAASEQPTDPIWFFQLQQDGYDPGTSRDLTQDPDPARNELPLMVEAIKACRQSDWHVRLKDAEGNDVAYGKSLRPSDGVPGNLVLLNGDGAGQTLRAANLQEGLLVAIFGEEKNPTGWFRLPHNGTSVLQGSPYSTQAFDWQTLPYADAFADDFPDEWQISPGEDSPSGSCKFDSDNQQLRLLRGTSSTPRLRLGHVDAQDEEATLHALALLVGDDGHRLSPLLTAINGDNTPVEIDIDKLEGFAVSLMRDPAGEIAGGVIPLSSEPGEEGTEAEAITAYLLLWTQLETPVYTVQENGSEGEKLAVLLDDGLLVLQSDDAGGQVLVDIGEPVATRQDIAPRGLALTAAGKVLGVLLDRAQVSETSDEEPIRYVARSFEPREYLVVPTPEQPGLPADILADIRRNQARIGQKIDALLGMIAAPAHLDHPLPPTAINLPLMVEHLNQVQFGVWEVVREQCQEASATHFRLEDVAEGIGDLTEDAVRQQLDLFERMGLIVPVTVRGQAFFRLATPLDDATIKHHKENDAA